MNFENYLVWRNWLSEPWLEFHTNALTSESVLLLKPDLILDIHEVSVSPAKCSSKPQSVNP